MLDPQLAAPPPAPAAPARRARARGPLLLGLLVMLGFTFCGYTGTDVWCNEALAQLEKCCPGFDASVYTCQPPTFPMGCESYAFDVEQGKRIALSSCQQLVAAGTCEHPFGPPGGGAAP